MRDAMIAALLGTGFVAFWLFALAACGGFADL